MPTGYTEKVVNGEVTELTDFIKILARSRGAYYHMRDKPLDTSLQSLSYNGDEYHYDNIIQIKKELAVLENFEKAKRVIINNLKERMHTLKLLSAKNDLYNSRLEIMRDKLGNWNPPKEYENIREFGIEQLKISFNDNSYYKESISEIEGELKRLETLSDEDWKTEINNAINDAQKDIAYHSSEIENNQKRCADALAYHEGLMKEIESLKNGDSSFGFPK